MKKNESQATAILNGWEFQYAAALFLLIDNISTYKSVGFEKKEDVVLNRKNNSIDYAQAKSSSSENEIFDLNHYAEIYKSIDTLSKKDHSNCCQSIIIFNYRNPFGDDRKDFYVGKNYSILKFENLPEKAKIKISKYVENKKYNIDLNKLYFYFLSYEIGSEIDALKQRFNEKLSLIDYYAPSKSETILLKWKELLSQNGRVYKGSVDISTFMGVLFSQLLKDTMSIGEFSRIYNLDLPASSAQFAAELNRYFDRKSSSILVYCKIIGGLINFINENKIKGYSLSESQIRYVESISEVPEDFSILFKDSCVDKLLLYKLFCCYVIEKQDQLTKIKEVFNYDN